MQRIASNEVDDTIIIIIYSNDKITYRTMMRFCAPVLYFLKGLLLDICALFLLFSVPASCEL